VRIVGISGAQGGGKSSLLNELKARGYTVDDFRVSRAVQAQLGWASLDNVMESFDTMKAFQDEVFNQKYEQDMSYVNNGKPGMVLTERTFADIFAYTQLWAWKLLDDGEDPRKVMPWLGQYYKKCQQAQIECYSATILLPLMSHVVFEVDPHRAKKEDAERVYEEITRFTDLIKFQGHPSFVISEKTVEARADQTEGFLKLAKNP